MQLYLFSIACLFTCTVIAKIHPGRFIDRETRMGIPYVNIGLLK